MCGCDNCVTLVYCLCAENDSFSGMQNFIKSEELYANYKSEAKSINCEGIS